MNILAKSLALVAAFAASTALAQTAPPAPPAKPDASEPANRTCPNGQMMTQGRMMGGQGGAHMGAAPGGQAAKPGAMMSGRMMGKGGANCIAQAPSTPDAKGQDKAPSTTK
ncbi:MAG: hypothetical protein ACXU8S_03310 [Phenylobacterium sp.]